MFKPSKEVLELAGKTKKYIENDKNVVNKKKKLRKEREDVIDIYVNDVAQQIKALGFKTSVESDRPQVYKTLDISFPKSELGGVVTFIFEDTETAVVDISFSAYASCKVDSEINVDFFTQESKSNKYKEKVVSDFADVVLNASKIYSIFDTSFNDKSAVISKKLKEIDTEIDALSGVLIYDDVYIMQRELMERVALEVYSHIKKTKTFIFKPKKGTELMGDVNSNKGFYFSMDGQADTFGERFRFTQHGATDSAYLSVVEDFVNIDGIHRAGTDKKYQPLFIERGGYRASPMEKFTVQKMDKNFKGVAVSSSSDDVVSNGISMITPKKIVSMNMTDEPIDNVFVAKGGLLGILALWTNELDLYKKLFVNN